MAITEADRKQVAALFEEAAEAGRLVPFQGITKDEAEAVVFCPPPEPQLYRAGTAIWAVRPNEEGALEGVVVGRQVEHGVFVFLEALPELEEAPAGEATPKRAAKKSRGKE